MRSCDRGPLQVSRRPVSWVEETRGVVHCILCNIQLTLWDCTDSRRLLFKLGSSFFLFGLINNVLYVVILSAALDLVPPNTPKGIIAFCNIFPALVAKVGWPYILKGRIRYARRIIGNCILSVLGMVVSVFLYSLSGVFLTSMA